MLVRSLDSIKRLFWELPWGSAEKGLALSLLWLWLPLWHEFDPWPGNFYMAQVEAPPPKKKPLIFLDMVLESGGFFKESLLEIYTETFMANYMMSGICFKIIQEGGCGWVSMIGQ